MSADIRLGAVRVGDPITVDGRQCIVDAVTEGEAGAPVLQCHPVDLDVVDLAPAFRWGAVILALG